MWADTMKNNHNFHDQFDFAMAQHPVKENFWHDVLYGIGRAFDPLPPNSPQSFCTNDQAAFLADVVKLSIDRDEALSKLEKSGEFEITLNYRKKS